MTVELPQTSLATNTIVPDVSHYTLNQANNSTAIKNSPLPPSVEKAYHLKCIELKRRLMEVEENNDAARLRVHRLERGISKIRVERAILLEHLRKRQQEMADLGSDGEDDQPPSVRSRHSSSASCALVAASPPPR